MREVKPRDSEPGIGSTEAEQLDADRPEGSRPDDGSPQDGSPDDDRLEDRDPESGGPESDRSESGRGGRRRRGMREQSATQRALGLLTRREHSRKELQRKLTSRGMDAAEVETAVETLSGLGWQDDARFAESLVRSRAGGGYGPIRLRAELATHGLDSEAIARALDSYEGDWLENARDLVRRRFPGLSGEAGSEDLALRRKAADFLMRRGFDGERVRKATRFDLDD